LAGVGLITLLFQILMGMMINTRVGMSTTRLQATMDELRRKNTEVEAFVYIVSHDLRAPLVNLQGFVRELEGSCARMNALAASKEMHNKEIAEVLDGEVAGALRFISASSTKVDRLIKALLNLSRQGRQTYKWTLVDVQELVAGTVASLQQLLDESGASLRVGSLPPAFADENSLSQIFSNLIANAVKYREPKRPLQIEVGGETECNFVRYWVRDNGLGLPDASKDRLFQAFQRFHPQRAEGDGMGLALVHRIAERHGGKVWVESQEGVGSTFYFSVPASPLTAPV
jgi:signal transduction histidine kinase